MAVTSDPVPLDLPNHITALRFQTGIPRLQSPYATTIVAFSEGLADLPCLVPILEDLTVPTATWTFRLDRPAWVLLSVHQMGDASMDSTWQPLPHGVLWSFRGSMRYQADRVYARHCETGVVTIPAHPGRTPRGWPARPHLVMLASEALVAPAPGRDRDALLVEANRIESFDLVADGLSATIQTKPSLRLTAFVDGSIPAMLAPPAREPCGLRTWFMEPCQNEDSGLIACRPAHYSDRGPDHCSLSTGVDPSTSLELLWEVRLHPRRRKLLVRHGLRNHATTQRRLALWPLVAGAAPQRMKTVMLRDPDNDAMPTAMIPSTAFVQDRAEGPRDLTAILGVHQLDEALVLDGAVMHGTRWLKAGLRAATGTAALVDGHYILRSRIVAHEPGPYPEGDRNLTTYRADDIIEIEHVGPLCDVAPGEAIWLDQELSLHVIPTDEAGDIHRLVQAIAHLD